MFAYPEMIVGLWFVPVVLCILVPLTMLSIWTVIQIFKKMTGEKQRIKPTTKKKQGGSYNKSFGPQLAT